MSSWEKPDEMKTEQEKALHAAGGSWKEYTSAGGKKYYYNAVTKATQWTMPDEMKVALETASVGQAAASPQTAPACAPVSDPAAAKPPPPAGPPASVPSAVPASAIATPYSHAPPVGNSSAAVPPPAAALIENNVAGGAGVCVASESESADAKAGKAQPNPTDIFTSMLTTCGCTAEMSWEEARQHDTMLFD